MVQQCLIMEPVLCSRGCDKHFLCYPSSKKDAFKIKTHKLIRELKLHGKIWSEALLQVEIRPRHLLKQGKTSWNVMKTTKDRQWSRTGHGRGESHAL